MSWESRGSRRFDVIVVDQVSAVIPVFRAFTPARILFYCHFPDLLLAAPKSLIHALYRVPLDAIEQATTGMAHAIAVNSIFTQGVFEETFSRLARRGVVPEVIYPAVNPPNDAQLHEAERNWKKSLPDKAVVLISTGPTFLSINRFERKKNIGLAIEALHKLVKKRSGTGFVSHSNSAEEEEGAEALTESGGVPSGPRLIIAGGYDTRLAENVEHLRELGWHAAKLGVRDRVTFMPSFTDEQRAALLAACVAVLYTPTGEHFGIVPLEAMAAGRPVVACNSGGPLESIEDRTTGFLRQPLPEEFAGAMEELLDKSKAAVMGRQARAHVLEKFSRSAFGDRLNQVVTGLAEKY